MEKPIIQWTTEDVVKFLTENSFVDFTQGFIGK